MIAQVVMAASWVMSAGLTTPAAIALAALGWTVQAAAVAGVVANTVNLYAEQPIYHDDGGMDLGFGIGSVFVATVGGSLVGWAVQISRAAAVARALEAANQAGRGVGTALNGVNPSVQARATTLLHARSTFATRYGSMGRDDAAMPMGTLNTAR